MLKFQACFFLSLGEGHKCTRYFFFFCMDKRYVAQSPYMLCFVIKRGRNAMTYALDKGNGFLPTEVFKFMLKNGAYLGDRDDVRQLNSRVVFQYIRFFLNFFKQRI